MNLNFIFKRYYLLDIQQKINESRRKKKMRILLLVACVSIVLFSLADCAEENKKSSKKQLQIGIKKKVENCSRTSKKGDQLSM